MTRSLPLPTRRRSLWIVPTVPRGVQLASLAFFVWLAVVAVFPFRTALPVDLYFRLDPLVALAASLGGRGLAPNALWALPVLLLTLAFGRAFCGWLCPLGTVLDAFRFDNRARRLDYPRLRGSALLPVPARPGRRGARLAHAPRARPTHPAAPRARDRAAAGARPRGDRAPARDVSGRYPADLASAVDAALRPAILPIEQHEYRGGALMFAALAGVVALDLLAPRFWCRYLCPLGALLALVGRVTPLRRFVGSDCDRCAKCVAQ